MMENNISDNRKTALSATLVLIGVIAVFTVISFVKPSSDFSEAENRALQEKPDFDLDDVLEGDYQEEYEEYLSDQMIGRSFFVKIKTELDILMGKKDINDVYLADEDYLIEKYSLSDFDEEQVEDNVWYLSEFIADMQDRYDSEHVQCMFVPSKGTVLSSLLPENARAFDTSYVIDEVAAELPYGSVLDLTEALMEHSDEYIYYRTDHHWTTLGAFYAYCAYKEAIGEAAPSIDNYTISEVASEFYGTTYDKVQIKKTADTVSRFDINGAEYTQVTVDFDDGEKTWDTFYDEESLSEKDKYTYFLGGNTAKIKISAGAAGGKTLLLLKDSFSNSFVEFLAGDYENIYMIDLRYTSDDIYTLLDEIEEENEITDVLVMYNTEKFMQDSNLWMLESE